MSMHSLLNIYACVAGPKLFKSSSPWLQRHPDPPKSSKTASPAHSSSYLRFSARAQPLPPLEQSYWKKWIQPAVGLPLTVQSWCWPPILIFCLDFGALDFGSTVLAYFDYHDLLAFVKKAVSAAVISFTPASPRDFHRISSLPTSYLSCSAANSSICRAFVTRIVSSTFVASSERTLIRFSCVFSCSLILVFKAVVPSIHVTVATLLEA